MILAGQVMVGSGFTVTVAVVDGPVQPLAVGMIVKVTVTGEVVKLVMLPVILPVPVEAIPVMLAVLSRDQV